MKTKLFIVLFFAAFMTQAQGPLLLDPGSSLEPRNDYAIGTAFFSGVNAVFSTYNIVRLTGEDPNPHDAFFGILAGTAQTAYGLININSHYRHAPIYSAVNAGVGLFTIATGALRLVKFPAAGKNGVRYYVSVLPADGLYATAPRLYLSARF